MVHPRLSSTATRFPQYWGTSTLNYFQVSEHNMLSLTSLEALPILTTCELTPPPTNKTSLLEEAFPKHPVYSLCREA